MKNIMEGSFEKKLNFKKLIKIVLGIFVLLFLCSLDSGEFYVEFYNKDGSLILLNEYEVNRGENLAFYLEKDDDIRIIDSVILDVCGYTASDYETYVVLDEEYIDNMGEEDVLGYWDVADTTKFTPKDGMVYKIVMVDNAIFW